MRHTTGEDMARAKKSEPRFTKLDAKGNPMPADATGHVAVRDNASGLIWEAM